MKTRSELYERHRNNPEGLVEYLVGEGFKGLGWQVHSGNCPELKECLDKGHMGHKGETERRVRDIQHNQRGSDVTYWCEDCKIYWKIDMSD